MKPLARDGQKPAPWYRHRWPWLLMAGPLAVVVAGAVTLYLAVLSNDGLVDDDYYKLGLTVNQTSARDRAAAAKGLAGQLMQSAEGGQLRLLLRANAGVELPPTLKLKLAHPTRAGVDREVALRAEGTGVYRGSAGALLTGRWHVVIEDGERSWRLTAVWNVDTTPVLGIGAP